MAALTVSGRYLLGDAVEQFTFDGTTYASSVAGAPLTVVLGDECRLHAEAGGWVLRGGTVGPDVLWRRGEDEREAVADGFTGASPAYALAVVRRLDLEVGQSRRLRLVAVTAPVLATRLVDEQWSRPAADSWEAADLATGERRTVRIEGGLVVEGSGLTLTRL